MKFWPTESDRSHHVINNWVKTQDGGRSRAPVHESAASVEDRLEKDFPAYAVVQGIKRVIKGGDHEV